MREAGGLFIIGTERHESRRIDNQLRGRAGRQGDPGESRVLHRPWRTTSCACSAASASQNLMNSLGVDDDDAHRGRRCSPSAIETRPAQASRAATSTSASTCLQYDDVMNEQREVIYGQRQQVLDGRGPARASAAT